MRVRLLLVLAALCCARPVLSADRCVVVIDPAAPVLEQEAAQQLQQYFERLFGFQPRVASSALGGETYLLLGQSGRRTLSAGERWPALGDQDYVLRSGRVDGRPALAAVGGSPISTLWAAYELLESYGVRYLLTGDVLPAGQQAFRLPNLNVVRKPVFPFRCWRIWNVHAFGPESWGMDEQRRIIDQLVKMRFNAVLVYLWPFQPFVDYQYGGVHKTSGDLFFGWKYPLGPDTIGLAKFGGVTEFTNPDFRDARTYEERLAAGQKLMHGMLAYAHSKGLKTILSFALIDFPQEFKDQFKNWLPPEAREVGDDKSSFIYQSLYTVGTDREGAAFLDVDNPRLMELVETIVRAYIDTYPEADSYCFGATEFRSAVTGYQRIWKLLDQKYGFERVLPLETMLRQSRNRRGWSPARAESEVQGDVDFLYFFERLINERKILSQTRRPDAPIMLSHLASEVHPLLPLILPKGSGYLANLDYTLARSTDRLSSLQGLNGLQSLLILTLNDDNIATLLQMPGRSAETVLQAMHRYGVQGYMIRYWMTGGSDLVANFVARFSWDSSVTMDRSYRELMAQICGPAAVADVMQAVVQLEETTAWLENAGLLGYGFPVPDMLERHFEETVPGSEAVEEAVSRYSAALPHLRSARLSASENGKAFLDYLIARLECSVTWLRLTATVRQAGAAYRDHMRLRKEGRIQEAIAKGAVAQRLARRSQEESYAMVEQFARVTRDQSDRGMLAILNRYVYQYARSLNLRMEVETEFWRTK